MNLIYSNLLASFANQSKNPKKTLVIRGLLASLGSIVFSLVNLQIARTWRLPQDLPSSLVWLTLVVVVQILVGLVVYIGSHNLKLGSNFNRLAVSWPMPSSSGWLVRNLNLLILAGILLIIIGPSVVLSSKNLGLSLIATWLAVLVGSLSGLGLGQYQIGRSSLVGSLLSGIVALSEINLISQIIDQTVWTGDNRFLFGCLII